MIWASAFNHVAQWTARQCGHPITFILACASVLVWALCGPVFQYSADWQLVINTATTVITFLIVFLIQNTQNRDMAVLQLKLDELIRASDSARNQLMGLEDMTEDELLRLKRGFTRLSQAGDQLLTPKGDNDVGS